MHTFSSSSSAEALRQQPSLHSWQCWPLVLCLQLTQMTVFSSSMQLHRLEWPKHSQSCKERGSSVRGRERRGREKGRERKRETRQGVLELLLLLRVLRRWGQQESERGTMACEVRDGAEGDVREVIRGRVTHDQSGMGTARVRKRHHMKKKHGVSRTQRGHITPGTPQT